MPDIIGSPNTFHLEARPQTLSPSIQFNLPGKDPACPASGLIYITGTVHNGFEINKTVYICINNELQTASNCSPINYSPGDTSFTDLYIILPNALQQEIENVMQNPGGGIWSARFNIGFTAETNDTRISVDITNVRLHLNYNPDDCLPCLYDIDPESAHYGAEGATGSFDLITSEPSCEWSLSSTQSWIHITSPTSGAGSTTVSYSVDANEQYAARSGGIAVNALPIPLFYAITQDGVGCALSIDPLTSHYPVEGGTGFVRVSVPEECSWSALSDSGWIAPVWTFIGDIEVGYTDDGVPIIIGTPGSRGPGWIVYNVERNNMFSPALSPPRTGHITVSSDSDTEVHTVTQDGDPGGTSPSDISDAVCLETDSPRAWLHVGGGAQVQTFHTTQNAFNFGGQPAPASIRGLATDRRRGALAILSETEEETTWKLYVSTDGGQSAELVKTMTYKSACLAYDSERGALVVMGATVADAIEWNVSRDGGATWESPIAATKDDGNPLTGQVKDIAHDTRAAVFALLLDTGSAMQVWTSGEVGKSWTLALG